MFDIFLWFSNNPVLTLLIFTSIILPLLERYDANSRIYYWGDNRNFGFTISAAIVVLVAIIIFILSI